MFSLSKMLKNILILLSLIVVLVLPVDAFDYNFNDGDLTSWTIDGLGWTTIGIDQFNNQSGLNLIDVSSNGENNTLTRSSTSSSYYSIKMKYNYTAAGAFSGDQKYIFETNSSSSRGIILTASGVNPQDMTMTCFGFSCTSRVLPLRVWHEYTLSISATSINITVLNQTGGILYNEIVSYVPLNSVDSMHVGCRSNTAGVNTCNFDDIRSFPVGGDSSGSLSFSSGSYISGELITLTSSLVNPDFVENKYYVIVDRSDGTLYSQYNIYDTIYSQDFVLDPAIKLTATLHELNLAAGIYADEVVLASAEIIPLGYSGEPLLSGNDISWWSSTYTLGSSGNISYLYETGEFGFLENPYIRISKNGVVLREYPTDFGVVSRSGGKLSYHFPEVGEYTVTLGKKFFLGSFQELKSSTTVVSISTGMLGVASSVPTNNPFNVTYTSSLGTSSSQDRVIKLYYYNSGSLEFLTEYFYSGLSPSGTTQFKVTKPGNYYMKLLDLASGEMVLDAVDFSAYASVSLPTGNYTSSNISLIKSTWAADEILSGDYYIQSDYYRNSTIYFNFTGTSSKCIPLSDHGRFNCLVYLPAGSNVIHMIAQNGSTLTELANYTFTVSLLTTTGYRLSVFPDRLNIGEQYTVSIISPSNSVLNVTYNGVNGEALNELLSSSPINGSISFTKTASKRGYYTFELLDDNSNVVMIQSLTVIDPTVSENGTGRNVEYPPIPSGRDAGAGIIDSLLGFMTLPIFWGVLFLGACLYYLRNSSGLLLPVLFIMINIEAVVGLLDPYGTYIVIITWLVMAIFFIFVQRKTTG